MAEDKPISKIRHLTLKGGKPEIGAMGANYTRDNSLNSNFFNQTNQTELAQEEMLEDVAPILKKPHKDFAPYPENPKNKNENKMFSKLPGNLPMLSGNNTEKSNQASNKNINVNSFGAIFNQDHNQVTAARRVFKKSLGFLIAGFFFFALLLLFGLNLFYLNSNPVFSLVSGVIVVVLSVVTSSLFFIILADRSYLWIYLAGQIILTLFTHSFIGLGFDRFTLLITFIITLLTYLAYTELEKIQLSSRLFSIGAVVAECARTLSTAAILVLCLGVYNQIIYKGTENGVFGGGDKFFAEVFLDKKEIMDPFIIGKGRGLNLNTLLMRGFLVEENVVKVRNEEGNLVQASFRDFLTVNYNPTKTLFNTTENEDELEKCQRNKVTNCDQPINQIKDQRLLEWKNEAYTDLDLALDIPLERENFRQVTKQYYTNYIKSFGKSDTNNNGFIPADFLILESKYIIPITFVFLLYILLTLLRPLINFLIFAVSWLIWTFLKAIGVVRIEIETVEAEVVSI